MKHTAFSPTPIDCREAEENLVAYAKRDLPPAQQQAVAAHLAACDACAQALRDFRALEAELRAAAARPRASLSPAASQRIQRQVYRRMRLSLVWQRLFRTVETAVSVTAVLLMVGAISVIGYFWLQFLANPSAPVAGDGTRVSAPAAATLAATAAPLPTTVASQLAPMPQPATPQQTETTARPLPPYWQDLNSVTPGQRPSQISQTIVAAALAGDQAQLNQIFAAMGSAHDPTVQLWQQFSRRCQLTLTADALTYQELSPGVPFDGPIVKSVYLLYAGRYVGEVKLRLIDGDWYAFFTRPPAVNDCLKDQLHRHSSP